MLSYHISKHVRVSRIDFSINTIFPNVIYNIVGQPPPFPFSTTIFTFSYVLPFGVLNETLLYSFNAQPRLSK